MSATAKIRAAFRRPLAWVITAVVVIAILATAGPYLYLHSVSSHNPKPLSFSQLATARPAAATARTSSAAATSTTAAPVSAAAPVAGAGPVPGAAPPPAPGVSSTTAAAPANAVAGNWTVGSGSQARYGIDDTVLGQTSRVVGSTDDVSGSMTIAGMTVTAVHVTVNMAAVRCGCVHDAMYPRLLETGKYPSSTFDLTSPIDISSVPAPGTVLSVPVTGNFTIHGVTRATSFTLQVTDIDGRIAAKGSIPVSYSAYRIVPPPGGGVGGLSNTTIDLLIAFDKS